MKSLDSFFDGLCSAAALVCGYLLLFAAVFVTTELITRKVGGISIGGANEVSGYILGITTAWAFSYTMLKRAHIRIDVFTRALHPRARAVTHLLAVGVLAAFVGVMVWFAWGYFGFVWQKNTRSITSMAVPLWIPILFWAAGWTVFLAVCTYLFVVSLGSFLRGDLPAVQERVGTVVEEEELIVALDGDDREASSERT